MEKKGDRREKEKQELDKSMYGDLSNFKRILTTEWSTFKEDWVDGVNEVEDFFKSFRKKQNNSNEDSKRDGEESK